MNWTCKSINGGSLEITFCHFPLKGCNIYDKKGALKSFSHTARDVNVFSFLKRWKRRRKIENKSFFLKKRSFSKTIVIRSLKFKTSGSLLKTICFPQKRNDRFWKDWKTKQKRSFWKTINNPTHSLKRMGMGCDPNQSQTIQNLAVSNTGGKYIIKLVALV